jgi:hypothetical protein
MAKFQKLKPILEVINQAQGNLTTGNTEATKADIVNLLSMVQDLKKDMVGEEGITYNFKCTKCGLNPPCRYSGGLNLEDLKFCLDEYKSGPAEWNLLNKTKGEV